MFQSNRERPPYKIQRQFMGWLTHHNVDVLHEKLSKPTHDGLSRDVMVFAYKQPKCPLVTAIGHPIDKRYVAQADQSFRQTMDDVTYLFRLAVQSPDAQLVDAALRQTDDFVDGVANFARLPSSELQTYVHVQRRAMENGAFDLARFKTDAYELVQEEEDLRTKGCPFAKKQENWQHRDPLFDRFVRWGAQLSMMASADLVTQELLTQTTEQLQGSELHTQ